MYLGVAVVGDHPAMVPVGNVPIVVDAQEGHPPRLPEAPQVDAHARGALPRLVGHHLYTLSPEPAALVLNRVGVRLPRNSVQGEGDGLITCPRPATHEVVSVKAEPVVGAPAPMSRLALKQNRIAVLCQMLKTTTTHAKFYSAHCPFQMVSCLAGQPGAAYSSRRMDD